MTAPTSAVTAPTDRRRIRLAAAGAAVVTLCAGLGVRAVADGDVAKYAGDALYTVLLCTLVVLVAPAAVTRRTAAGIGLGLSWAIELGQLTGVPAALSQHSVIARLVLGSTFNAPDLFWYAVGAGLFLLICTVVPRPSGPRHAP